MNRRLHLYCNQDYLFINYTYLNAALGIDVGTSSMKIAVVDEATKQCIAVAQCPEQQAAIIFPHTGRAEQSPNKWQYAKQAIEKVNAEGTYNSKDIAGIAYQIHALVWINKCRKL